MGVGAFWAHARIEVELAHPRCRASSSTHAMTASACPRPRRAARGNEVVDVEIPAPRRGSGPTGSRRRRRRCRRPRKRRRRGSPKPVGRRLGQRPPSSEPRWGRSSSNAAAAREDSPIESSPDPRARRRILCRGGFLIVTAAGLRCWWGWPSAPLQLRSPSTCSTRWCAACSPSDSAAGRRSWRRSDVAPASRAGHPGDQRPARRLLLDRRRARAPRRLCAQHRGEPAREGQARRALARGTARLVSDDDPRERLAGSRASALRPTQYRDGTADADRAGQRVHRPRRRG